MSAPHQPSVHLWVYNHPFYGISDQVEFFISAFQQNGYAVTVGRKPKVSALNVVIENFSTETRDTLIEFCRSTKKRVAVIMTEHLDFQDGQMFIHGDPLWSDNDYMHPATQVRRIVNLIDSLPYIRCFFVLGDLPELRNMSAVLPGIDVRAIPFPKLDSVCTGDMGAPLSLSSDLLFTGALTDHRANLHMLLRESDLSVAFPQKFVSRKKRDVMNRSTRLILNIPQRQNWRWLSLMRIVAALRCGRATVSLGTRDDSKIAACTYQLDISRDDWLKTLKDHVNHWVDLYRTAHENYTRMAEEFESKKRFPHDLLEYWDITDGIGH